ncbi:Hypothetical predicted protein [Podarcis lilfordi]|uniref:Uncharacterized protein n=1 Tax=Podarcis lilfordi TaxID=74358 RepID=A0AA35JQL9_9SAUR|nr:Hypothetical predicted protein [Podarcis lilfordi]
MRQRQHTFVSVVSLMTVLCSLSQGCPTEAGPTCAEELPNAISIISRLKKCLRDLYKTLVDDGYGGRELRGPVCLLRNNGIVAQPTDLGTIDTRLCQYTKCFQHYAGIIRPIGRLRPNIHRQTEYCQKYLNQLENTVKKMKLLPTAPCSADSCRISWTFTDQWDELTKGTRLAQELLEYLEHLKFSCS